MVLPEQSDKTMQTNYQLKSIGMASNQTLVGSIDLSALNGVQLNTTVNGRQTVVIPVAENPSIFVGAKEKGGHIYMDIEVREVSENQYGNTHFVKLSVGKKKRDEMRLTAEALKKYTPIIGNLKPLPRKAQTDEDLPVG